jgi:hypothetical protein
MNTKYKLEHAISGKNTQTIALRKNNLKKQEVRTVNRREKNLVESC